MGLEEYHLHAYFVSRSRKTEAWVPIVLRRVS